MFLLGDSHATAIRNAAKSRGVRLFGGMLDGGRNLHLTFYLRTEGDFVFLNDQVETLYRNYLLEAGVSRISELEMPVLCLFGMNIHYLSRQDVWSGFDIGTNGDGRFLSHSVVSETVRNMIPGALQFYRDLAAIGFKTYSALPPRRTPTSDTKTLPAIFRGLEDVLLGEIGQLGVHVLDHRGWSLDREGQLKSEYAHPDPRDDVHGSELFGKRLLEQLADEEARESK
jgi:hypothetical protein